MESFSCSDLKDGVGETSVEGDAHAGEILDITRDYGADKFPDFFGFSYPLHRQFLFQCREVSREISKAVGENGTECDVNTTHFPYSKFL